MVRFGIAAAAVLLATSAVRADPVTFFGETPSAGGVFPTSTSDPSRVAEGLFQTAMDVLRTETFSGSTAGFLGLAGNSMPVLNGGTLTQAPGIQFDPFFGTPINNKGVEIRAGQQYEGRFNTTGGAGPGNWVESDTNFTINLGINEGVGGFGFYGTDFGDFDGTLVIELYRNGTRVVDNAFTDDLGVQRSASRADSGSLLFFGWASSTIKFDRIDFKITQATGVLDVLGVDDIMIGNLKTTSGTVPEPGSLALAGLALFAAGWARKTQRRA